MVPTEKNDDDETPLPDTLEFAPAMDEALKTLRTALDRLDGDGPKQIRIALDRVERVQQKQEQAYYELMHTYCQLCKRYAIQAPPDQPPLQTVPWTVGHPATTINNKGELSKRTEHSVATIQKNNNNKK